VKTENPMPRIVSITPARYVCPKCKHALSQTESALQCTACNRIYPIVGGIPDFISDNFQARTDPNYRWNPIWKLLAPIYESRLWHSFVLGMAGAGNSSLESIADFISQTLEGVTGNVLDVACGPATYGRRMASPKRNIYGIDFSMGTLQQGMKNIRRAGISNIQLAQTRVEELPFEEAVFDGAICGGSLHLFPDTLLALLEIARTMKAGAPLAVTTFVTGDSLAARLVKQRKNKNMHTFELPELQRYFNEAGFEGFSWKQDGTFATFSTHRVKD
jgi:SAM-dependent methyltransferase